MDSGRQEKTALLFRETEDVMNQFYYIARVRIKQKTDTEKAYFGRGVAERAAWEAVDAVMEQYFGGNKQ